MNLKNKEIKKLDKDLTEEQQQEWNSIYASYRAGSLLTGRVVGADNITIKVLNPETQKKENKTIRCLVVIDYRVKVLIPETEIWYSEEAAKPVHVLNSMIGSVIDYVIKEIDREGECCIASRTAALHIRRRNFLKLTPRSNKRVECSIIAVGKTKVLCSCGGFDITVLAADCLYASVSDLRKKFQVGETRDAILKIFNPETQYISISIKEANPHPFDGADQRHPLNSRRVSVIVNKYLGGVFCQLDENLTCLCSYSPEQYDEDFHIGDRVIIVIKKFNYEKKSVYGKIISKL